MSGPRSEVAVALPSTWSSGPRRGLLTIPTCPPLAAGNAFCQAAQLHLQLQSKHDAAANFVDAGNAFKKADPQGKMLLHVLSQGSGCPGDTVVPAGVGKGAQTPGSWRSKAPRLPSLPWGNISFCLDPLVIKGGSCLPVLQALLSHQAQIAVTPEAGMPIGWQADTWLCGDTRRTCLRCCISGHGLEEACPGPRDMRESPVALCNLSECRKAGLLPRPLLRQLAAGLAGQRPAGSLCQSQCWAVAGVGGGWISWLGCGA